MPERILMTISGLFGHNFRQTKRVKDMECGHCGMWTCVKVKENEKKVWKCRNDKTCQGFQWPRWYLATPCHHAMATGVCAVSALCLWEKIADDCRSSLSLSLCSLFFFWQSWNSKAKIPRWLEKCCSECLLSLKFNGSGAPLFQLCSCCCFPKESI